MLWLPPGEERRYNDGTMILTINAICDLTERQRFDQLVLPRLRRLAPADFSIYHLLDDPFPEDLDGLSHLLLSGSELSATEDHSRDAELLELIRRFVDSGKPVLGICFGHQMLARALVGDAVCRRAATPEFGWNKLSEIVVNPLFAGLAQIVSIHSHYDEVFDLGDEFTVLASTPECAVQAFQYRQLPVWGVQFHPELGYREGQRMLRRSLESEPRAAELAGSDLVSPEQADENSLILKNFFEAKAVRVNPSRAQDQR